MKRTKKLILVALALAALFALTAVVALAAGEEKPTLTWQWEDGTKIKTESVEELPSYSAGELVPFDGKSYKVSSYSANGDAATLVLEPTAYYYSITKSDGTVTLRDSTARFRTDFTSAPSGSTIKLLADIADAYSGENSNSLAVSGKTVNFDLNGFDFVITYSTTQTSGLTGFSVQSGAELHVFSSRAGGRIFNAQYQHLDSKGNAGLDAAMSFATFTLTSANSRLYLGDHGTEGTDGFCDGDNLSVYASILAEVYATDTNDGDECANLNISGGSYYRTCSNHIALILMRDAGGDNALSRTTAIIKNAKLWSANILFGFSNTVNTASEKQFKVRVENSVLYAQNKIISPNDSQFYDGRCFFDFKDCYLLAGLGATGRSNINLLEGCRTAADEECAEGYIWARILETKAVTFSKNVFSFTLSEDKSSATMDPSSFETPAVESAYRFKKVVTTESASSNITWKTDDETVTERWCNGVVPVPPMSVPEGNDIYKFTFGNVTAANGDKTYTLSQVAAFDIKLNLSLYDNFRYNVYIPASVKDSIGSVSVTRDGADNVNITVSEPELVTIWGAEHYKYSFGIAPAVGASTYSFKFRIKGYEDKYFTQTCTLSIPYYAVAILEGGYNDSAKELVKNTLLYVNAVYDYCGDTDTAVFDAIFKKYSITEAIDEDMYTGEAMESVPAGVLSVIKSASGNMDDVFSFRYYLSDNATEEACKAATVSWYEYNEVKTDSVYNLAAGKTYFDIPLRAAEMQKPMTVTVGNDTITYKLANYVYAVVNTEGYSATEVALVKNIWRYSEAAKNFANARPGVNVTIGDTPITDYVIVAETAEEKAAAELLSSAVEVKFGVGLDIVESAAGKSIVISTLPSNSPKDFYVTCDGEILTMQCSYKSFFTSGMRSFIEGFVSRTSGYNFEKDFKQEYFASKVYYSDFGATGDGVTNDFFAIKATHDVANAKSLTVYADAGATYYIGTCIDENNTLRSASIKTNTVWTGATFIIDDTKITKTASGPQDYVNHVFKVESDYPLVTLGSSVLESINQAGGLTKGETKKIETGLGYPAMLIIKNEEHTQYIRFGGNANSGAAQSELVLVDAEGNIDPSTPFLFDFEKVTSIVAYRADVTPITIEGGTFETKASRVNLANNPLGDYISINRAIYVTRPNVTLRNIDRLVTGEIPKYAIVRVDENGNVLEVLNTDPDPGVMSKDQPRTTSGDTVYTYGMDSNGNYYVKIGDTIQNDLLPFIGHSYGGFVNVGNTTNVTIENCEFYGRTWYLQGTYDIILGNANNVTFKNCTQPNFYETASPKNETVTEKTSLPNNYYCWGVMGSNYCKNIVYDGCTLTRYDAHCGVVNGKIINSTVARLTLIGGGDMLIENSTLLARNTATGSIIDLRDDYGSTWDGTITIKDCTFEAHMDNTTSTMTTVNVATVPWGNHDFGYETHLPNLVVDNLSFATVFKNGTRKENTVTKVRLFSLGVSSSEPNKSKYEAIGKNDGYSFIGADEITLSDGTTVENKNPICAPDFVVIRNKQDGVTYFLDSTETATGSAFFDLTVREGLPNLYDTPMIDYMG